MFSLGCYPGTFSYIVPRVVRHDNSTEENCQYPTKRYKLQEKTNISISNIYATKGCIIVTILILANQRGMVIHLSEALPIRFYFIHKYMFAYSTLPWHTG